MDELVPTSPPAGPQNGKGVLCVKCEHLNPSGLEKCGTCGAHLFVFCTRCGHVNARVHSRCQQCRRKLHRTARERWKGGEEPQPVNLFYVGLALAGILLLAGLIVWLADLRLPRLW